MNYRESQKVRLGDYFNEKWLQDRIEKNPAILGLPGDDLRVIRERRQSSGGRLDFLLRDIEGDRIYEVELMLGPTDASHIIRTIEYWDIERRKNPSKEHRAVIIAEEITARFFNVIYLMNRSIPIIAIKLDALKLGDNDLILHFTKVLDTYETPDDAVDLEASPTDMASWESWASKESMASTNAMIELLKQFGPIKITPNENHIALGTQRQNFCWLHPRKRQPHCHLYLSVGAENIEKGKELLVQAAIPFNPDESGFTFDVNSKDIQEKREILSRLCDLAVTEYSSGP
jgi:hypothetical protein